MPDGLYERDALAWAEHQADLLRRLATGERLNEAVDWPNVIEEVQDVGLSELRACQSLLQQAMTHLLKMSTWPDSRAASHWRDEAETFLDDAGRRFTPSIRQRIDLSDLYIAALHRVRSKTDDSGAQRPLPDVCPFALNDLLTSNADIETLMLRLASPAQPTSPSPSD